MRLWDSIKKVVSIIKNAGLAVVFPTIAINKEFGPVAATRATAVAAGVLAVGEIFEAVSIDAPAIVKAVQDKKFCSRAGLTPTAGAVSKLSVATGCAILVLEVAGLATVGFWVAPACFAGAYGLNALKALVTTETKLSEKGIALRDIAIEVLGPVGLLTANTGVAALGCAIATVPAAQRLYGNFVGLFHHSDRVGYVPIENRMSTNQSDDYNDLFKLTNDMLEQAQSR
ncbi:MAG: hypothetical protein A2X78_03345 [Gammaproteobacteria bacterium GWE2_37_16]|nr:MAG: hypothetical protein A2X78_03345 [Gammaproteobacteria bacterium GWE2_37_16]